MQERLRRASDEQGVVFLVVFVDRITYNTINTYTAAPVVENDIVTFYNEGGDRKVFDNIDDTQTILYVEIIDESESFPDDYMVFQLDVGKHTPYKS